MQKYKNILIGSVVVGLIAAAATFAIEVPKTWEFTTFDFYWPLASNVLMVCMHFGAVVLFLLSLTVYKAKFRVAFAGIVLGVFITAIGTLQIPIIDVLDAWGSTYVTTGIIGVPFLLAGFASYLGASTFGHLVNDASWLTKRWLVIPGGLLLGIILGTFIPHIPLPTKESDFDIAMSMNFWMVCLGFAATAIIYRLRQRMGTHYKKANTYLVIALFTATTTVLIATIDTFVSPHAHGPLMSAVNVLAIFAGWFWLMAGYTFAKTKEY